MCGVRIFIRSAGMSQRFCFKIDLAPPRADQLTRADEGERHQLERQTRDVRSWIDLDLPQ